MFRVRSSLVTSHNVTSAFLLLIATLCTLITSLLDLGVRLLHPPWSEIWKINPQKSNFGQFWGQSQRTLTPPDSWPCPTLRRVCVLKLRPISPERILLLDFWVSNIRRYFCFALGLQPPFPDRMVHVISRDRLLSLSKIRLCTALELWTNN